MLREMAGAAKRLKVVQIVASALADFGLVVYFQPARPTALLAPEIAAPKYRGASLPPFASSVPAWIVRHVPHTAPRNTRFTGRPEYLTPAATA